MISIDLSRKQRNFIEMANADIDGCFSSRKGERCGVIVQRREKL